MKNEFLTKLLFTVGMYALTVAVALIGILSYENVRTFEAASLGYTENVFEPGFGQVFFSNENLNSRFAAIKAKHADAIRLGIYFDQQSEWEALKQKNRRSHAFIELSGYIFVLVSSIVGFALLFYQRKKQRDYFGPISWVGVFLTLFIVKESVFSLVWLSLGVVLCDHANFAQYFNLPVFGVEWFWVIFGALSIGLVLFGFVPKNKRLLFAVAAFFGGITAGLLWLWVFGRIAFPSL